MAQLKGGELAPHYALLELFAFGTLPEHRGAFTVLSLVGALLL